MTAPQPGQDPQLEEYERLKARVAELEAEEARRAAEEGSILRLAEIVESSEDAIIGKTPEGIIQSWNRGAERIYGYEAADVIGRPMTLLLPPERVNEENSILERIRSGKRVDHFETTRVRKDGRIVEVSLTISPIRDSRGVIVGASHIARDVTERKVFERQLQQTQKLESLGVLAGGIAHDFNNLLTGMLGNASLALEGTLPTDPNKKLLEDVVKAARSAAELTRQLLAYAGKGRFVTEAVNLSDVVRSISELIQSSIPRNVRIRFELASNLPALDADIGQIQQVIMNLLINAAEAIGDGKNGTVVVATYTQQVDEDYRRKLWQSPELEPGRYIVLEVQDNGCGMDESTMARIFDPFYTTKFTGRGLGLAAVLGIVRSHRGALTVYSAPGEGSTFKLLFPSAEAATWKPALEAVGTRELRGTETVLVVDDEEIVRSAARNALERFGYTVLVAHDGGEAVEIFRRAAGRIDLVLLDLTMPVMGGEEALTQMLEIRPDVKVLLSSGFNEVEAIGRFTGQRLAGFVQKPYAATHLLRCVRSVLTPSR
jgi:PAS domain S-box-containing protein